MGSFVSAILKSLIGLTHGQSGSLGFVCSFCRPSSFRPTAILAGLASFDRFPQCPPFPLSRRFNRMDALAGFVCEILPLRARLVRLRRSDRAMLCGHSYFVSRLRLCAWKIRCTHSGAVRGAGAALQLERTPDVRSVSRHRIACMDDRNSNSNVVFPLVVLSRLLRLRLPSFQDPDDCCYLNSQQKTGVSCANLPLFVGFSGGSRGTSIGAGRRGSLSATADPAQSFGGPSLGGQTGHRFSKCRSGAREDGGRGLMKEHHHLVVGLRYRRRSRRWPGLTGGRPGCIFPPPRPCRSSRRLQIRPSGTTTP
jgi:hypothetical protein